MEETTDEKFAVIDSGSKNSNGDTLVKWFVPQNFKNVIEIVPNFRYTTTQDVLRAERRIVDSNQHTWILLSEFFSWLPEAISPVAMCEFDGSGPNAYTRPFIKSHIGRHDNFVFEMGGKYILANPKQIEKVRFITGHCLFSNRHLRATGFDGSIIDILNPRVALTKRIANITVDDSLSFYELEASLRLSRFLTDVALSLPPGMPFEIRLDIPFVQYYFYLIDAYWRNLVSKDLLLFWFEAIEKRHTLSVERMKRQIFYWFEKSDLPTPEFVVDEGLRSVKDMVVSHITGAHILDPKVVAAGLEKHDPAWKTINKLLNQNSYMDIVYASYSLEQLRANIEKLNDLSSPNTLSISIDNREENPTYESTARMMRKLKFQNDTPVLPILDMYPLERIFVANTFKFGLYSNDPGNLFFDESGRNFTIEDVLMAVYGVQVDIITNKSSMVKAP